MVDPADPVRVTGGDPATSTCRGAATSWPARWPRSARGADRRRAALPRRRRVHRRLHRRAAARRRRARWSPSTSGTGSWPGRCARRSAGRGARPDQRAHPHARSRSAAPVELTVADLSFISLRLVLPALAACTAPDGDLLPMVKPQFEVGQGAGRATAAWCATRQLRADAVLDVAAVRGRSWGWAWPAWRASPLPGPVRQRGVLPVAAAPARPGRRRGRGADHRRRSRRRADDERRGTRMREALLVTHTGRRRQHRARPDRGARPASRPASRCAWSPRRPPTWTWPAWYR